MTLPFPAPTDLVLLPKGPAGGKPMEPAPRAERSSERFRDMLNRTDSRPKSEEARPTSSSEDTLSKVAEKSAEPEAPEVDRKVGKDQAQSAEAEPLPVDDDEPLVVVVREVDELGEGEQLEEEMAESEDPDVIATLPLPKPVPTDSESSVASENQSGEPAIGGVGETEEPLEEESVASALPVSVEAQVPVPVPAPGAEPEARPTGRSVSGRTTSNTVNSVSGVTPSSGSGVNSLLASTPTAPTIVPMQGRSPATANASAGNRAALAPAPFIPSEVLAGAGRGEVQPSANQLTSLPLPDFVAARGSGFASTGSNGSGAQATGAGGEPPPTSTLQSQSQSRTSAARAEQQPAPPAGRPDTQFIFQKVAEGSERLRSDGRSRMELQVQLRDGSELKIRLQLQSGQLTATIRTDSHELRQSLQQSLPQLFSRLDQQGLNAVNVQLEYGDPSSSTSGSRTGQSEEDELASLTHRYIVKESGPESATNQPGAERISAPSVYSKAISKRIALHTWA